MPILKLNKEMAKKVKLSKINVDIGTEQETPLLKLFVSELKSLLKNGNSFEKILLPFFYINPDRIEFNGKLYLLVKHSLHDKGDDL